ncbi:MAG: AbrB/MazE/SpoVT family DNA-binding domain-containing protein [Nanoarchaeota archaeon]|nr:AbrB/MazE/SpoVT family DNA-binding domain-containing protein [Nanoarchaeota archaeon]
MKVLKEVSREYKEKKYIKYKVNLPSSLIKDAGLKVGDELAAEAEEGKIILKKATKIVE